MKNLLKILSRTELTNDGNTRKVLGKAIRNAFDGSVDREEAETLILLAHKYNLSCLDGMLKDLDTVPELPF